MESVPRRLVEETFETTALCVQTLSYMYIWPHHDEFFHVLFVHVYTPIGQLTAPMIDQYMYGSHTSLLAVPRQADTFSSQG